MNIQMFEESKVWGIWELLFGLVNYVNVTIRPAMARSKSVLVIFPTSELTKALKL